MLKVGDKVRINTSSGLNKRLWNLTCNLVEVRESGYKFPYIVNAGMSGRLPVLAHEIEKVVLKEQQLLFSFMD